MRILVFFLGAFLFSSCTTNSSTVLIPSYDEVVIHQVEESRMDFNLKNKSGVGLEVEVVDGQSKTFRSGFGIGPNGRVQLVVEENGQLSIKNPTAKAAEVKYKVLKKTESKPIVDQSKREFVSFVLLNKSARSIPLLIPSVMNPNLSPFSSSGVDLEIGQEILFRAKGKKYVLLTVTEKIEEGAKIDVASLLREKKKEYGL